MKIRWVKYLDVHTMHRAAMSFLVGRAFAGGLSTFPSRLLARSCHSVSPAAPVVEQRRKLPEDGPDLSHFLRSHGQSKATELFGVNSDGQLRNRGKLNMKQTTVFFLTSRNSSLLSLGSQVLDRKILRRKLCEQSLYGRVNWRICISVDRLWTYFSQLLRCTERGGGRKSS